MTGQKPAYIRIGVVSVLMAISLSGCSTITNWWGDKDQASRSEPTALPETRQTQKWYCYPEDAKSWDCVDQKDPAKVVPIAPLLAAAEAERRNSLSEPIPEPTPAPAVAPTQDISPEPLDAVTAVTLEAVGAPPPAVTPENNSLATQSDLLSQPASFYTVQLLARRDEQAVVQYAQSNGLPVPLYARIRSQGDNWYVLLLGIYPDQASADEAKRVWMETRTLKVEPWVRRLGPLQDAIREAGAG